jgi:hypothetical protein
LHIDWAQEARQVETHAECRTLFSTASRLGVNSCGDRRSACHKCRRHQRKLA